MDTSGPWPWNFHQREGFLVNSNDHDIIRKRGCPSDAGIDIIDLHVDELARKREVEHYGKNEGESRDG